MKVIIVCFAALCIMCGCKTPPITLLRQKPSTNGMTLIQLDTFDLFVRSVCVDSITKQPVDCYAIQSQIVENQYMFLSRHRSAAVIINNVPNRNQRFYTGSTKANLVGPGSDINSLLFKQFRIGTVKQVGGNVTLHFETTDRKSRKHDWECQALEVTQESSVYPALKVVSVQTQLPDGYDLRTTKAALLLPPIFVKRENFQIIYQVKAGSNARRTNLPNNRLWVNQLSKRKIETFLIFDDKIDDEGNTTIKFPSKRVYAYSK